TNRLAHTCLPFCSEGILGRRSDTVFPKPQQNGKEARMRPKLATLRTCVIATALFFTFAGGALRAVAQDGSLAQAYKIISSKRFVDLTHSFSPVTPVWKGFGKAAFSSAAVPQRGVPYTIPKGGFRSFFFSMVGQYGTHIDPPAHFDPNGMTMDEI